MSQRSSGPASPAGGDWPDDLWPADDDVAGVGGIKVGDQVSAQLTQAAGRVTAVTIADPAQAPGGGSVP